MTFTSLSSGPGPQLRCALLVAAVTAVSGCVDGRGGPLATSMDGLRSGGPLVIIGGGLSSTNREVYEAILDGREGEGPVCVIPTAGANPESSMEWSVERIDEWGGAGAASGLLLSLERPELALDPEVVSDIGKCGAFFFTGGDQSRILDFFLPDGEPTPAYDALMTRYVAGAGISGSSAGAAMVSDPMIAGGTSEGAFRSGITQEEGSEGVHVRQGMGFLPGTLIDQHFLARGRIGRLIVALAELEGVDVGWGIDENTALIVEGDRARVAGASGVVLVDASSVARGPGPSLSVEGVTIHLLGAGDQVDLWTLEVTPGEGKTSLMNASFPEPPPVEGAFRRWAFLHVLHGIARAPHEAVVVEAPDHLIHLRAAQGFRAVANSDEGVEGTPHGLSVGPLLASIEPTP